MKIKYAIHSSNSNQTYLDFWPIISEIWQTKFNITPVLIYIEDIENIIIPSDYGLVIRLKPIEGVSIISQTQIARIWATSLFPDDVSIISDIDMIPISKYYFIESIAEIEEIDYVHLHPFPKNYPNIPICYHVAMGKVFKDVLNIDTEWELFLKKVIDYGIKKIDEKKSTSWFIDEIYSTDKIFNYNGKYKLNLKKRNSGILDRRIDRSNWFYSNYLIYTEYYYDSHSIRPFNKFSKQITNLKNKILRQNKQQKNYYIDVLYIILFFIIKKFNRVIIYLLTSLLKKMKI
jgi:hypothetical protein